MPSSGGGVHPIAYDAEAPVLGQQQWEAVYERRARGRSVSASYAIGNDRSLTKVQEVVIGTTSKLGLQGLAGI